MKINTPLRGALLAAALLTIARAQPASTAIPHLEKRGAATQLIVDGQPWLILGGETANTASSSLAYMKPVWPRLARLNLNTVLVAVAWDWVEPVEGRFDFTLVDGLLEGARANNLRVVFLWFGSWKNGLSSFAPAWVKADSARFPRARLRSGQPVEVLTPLSDANRDADARAYTAFLRHLREVDGTRHTTLMIQMQNEVGLLGDSRDRSALANEAFAKPVPAALLDYLQKNPATLRPEIAGVWQAAGARTAGTWTEVFGATPAADEIFMAWHYARYMDRLTELGKAEYPLPVFTNTWIVQPEDKGPGDYPSGGPEPLTLEVWRAGAPHIDLNCPDIYLPNFTEWVARFHRNGHALFVPESRGDAGGVANAFYAIGQHASLGYSPFGIDNTGRRVVLRPDAGQAGPTDLENLPLAKGYALLQQLTPLILAHQAKGTLAAVSLDAKTQTQDVVLGNYTLNLDLRRNRRNPAQIPARGYAMIFSLGPDEYLVAGCDVQVIFSPRDAQTEIAGLASVEAGTFVAGRWTPGRKLSGDDVLLNYDQAAAAATRQSGSGLRFGPEGPSLQRVTLYRYH
jgi:hypothetical protein